MAPKERSRCAVRAFGAFCAEAGAEGRAYSMASSPGLPPWKWKTAMTFCDGGCAPTTVATFKEMFGADGINQDKDGKWKGAAQKLHLRASDVKKVIDDGYDVKALHETLSWHAWNKQMLSEPSATIAHSADGPVPRVRALLPRSLRGFDAEDRWQGRPACEEAACCTEGASRGR